MSFTPPPSHRKQERRPPTKIFLSDDEDLKPSVVKVEANLNYPSPPSSPCKRKAKVNSPSTKSPSKPAAKKPRLEADVKPAVKKERAWAVVAAKPHEDESDEEHDGDEYEEEHDIPLDVGAKVVTPSNVQGREVVWDRQVKTINTGKARSQYKLNDAYLYTLDRETTMNNMGYSKYLYSEFHVQQAAYNMRGGSEYFAAYVRRLHATKTLKASNKGKPTKLLDPKKPPLKVATYTKAKTPKSWVDNTRVKL